MTNETFQNLGGEQSRQVIATLIIPVLQPGRRGERRRCGAIEHQAGVGIGRDGGHAEQCLAVRPPVSLHQRTLMTQERRASHKKHRERRQADVGHGVVTVTTRCLAPVGETGTNPPQFRDQLLQRRHLAVESKFKPRRKAKSSHPA
jgi:hypothetical protein